MKKIGNYFLEMIFYFVVFSIVLYIGSLLKITTFSFEKTISFTIGYAIGRILFSLLSKKLNRRGNSFFFLL